MVIIGVVLSEAVLVEEFLELYLGLVCTVQLVAKIIKSVKTEKFNLELDKFLELIPDEPKMPN